MACQAVLWRRAKAIGAQTLQDFINTLEGKAMFDGAAYARNLRVAEYEWRIYIDLADQACALSRLTAPVGGSYLTRPRGLSDRRE
jgi:hypothetical protein